MGSPRTPMMAFSSVMVTCLARSTAWATCCWCWREQGGVSCTVFLTKGGTGDRWGQAGTGPPREAEEAPETGGAFLPSVLNTFQRARVFKPHIPHIALSFNRNEPKHACQSPVSPHHTYKKNVLLHLRMGAKWERLAPINVLNAGTASSHRRVFPRFRRRS